MTTVKTLAVACVALIGLAPSSWAFDVPGNFTFQKMVSGSRTGAGGSHSVNVSGSVNVTKVGSDFFTFSYQVIVPAINMTKVNDDCGSNTQAVVQVSFRPINALGQAGSVVNAPSVVSGSVAYCNSGAFGGGTVTGGAGTNYFYTGTGTSRIVAIQVSVSITNGTVQTQTFTYGKQYKIKVGARNTTDKAVRYDLIQNGQVVGSFTLQPGEAVIGPYNVPGNGEVSLTATMLGVTQSPDGSFTDFGGGEYQIGVVGKANPEEYSPSDPVSPTIESGTDGAPKPNAPSTLSGTTGATGTSNTAKPVWNSSTDGAGGGTGGLTNDTFKQGVNALASAIAKNGGGGGTGGETDMSGVHSRLDVANTNLQNIKSGIDDSNEHLEKIARAAEKHEALLDSEKMARETTDRSDEESGATAFFSSKIAGRKGELESAIAGGGDGSGDLPAMTDNKIGASSIFLIHAGPLGTINLDPFSNPAIDSAALWIKGLIAWVVVGLFQWWLWKEFQAVYFAVAGTQQAKGNTVAGSGGQAFALLAALIITGILVSVPGAYWAIADSGMSLWSLSENNPLADTPTNAVAGAVYLATGVVPVGTICAVLGQLFLVRKGGLVLVAGTQALIRAIVP